MNTQEILAYIDLHYTEIEDLKQIRKRCQSYIKTANAEKRIVAKATIHPQALRIADYLWEQINSRYNFQKNQNVLKWAQDIQRIPKKFNVDYPTVMAVAEYSQHDTFWRQNVRSGMGLEKHFDRLLVKLRDRAVNPNARRLEV